MITPVAVCLQSRDDLRQERGAERIMGVSSEFPLGRTLRRDCELATGRTAHPPPVPSQGQALDKTATGSLSRRKLDPSARLLSAGRVGLGFPPGQRIYRIVPLNHLVSF